MTQLLRGGRNGNPVRPTLYIPSNPNQTQLPCPQGLNVNPLRWSKEDVKKWLSWCLEEFALEGVDLSKFSMNGKALCKLTKPDFNDRARNGDVLFNTLQELLSPYKTSSVCLLASHSPVHHGGLPSSPHMDAAAYQFGNMTPVSPLDYLAASPHPASPHTLPRIKHNVFPMSRQNSQMHSRSPSPCYESPLDLSRERDQDSGVSVDDVISGTSEDHVSSHRLSVPTTPIGLHSNQYFHHTHSRSSRSISPGSRSPVRRPSPSGESLSPVPVKMQRMLSVDNGQAGGSPRHFSSNYLPAPAASSREPSPEHLLGLRQQFEQITRLDNNHREQLMFMEDNMQRAYPDTRHVDDSPYMRHVEGMSRAPPDDGEASEGSMESESSVHDDVTSAPNGHVRPVHIIAPTGMHPDPDYKHIPSQIPLTVNNVETADDCYDIEATEGDVQGDTKLLWEFIYQLLRSPDSGSLVRWEDEAKLVFRIINPAELAKQWGLQKSKGNMTYEKLSRALRYYYKMNIIVKEPQRRLTYRFVKPPESIQRGQKGAKPGVSHKRRTSTSPSCSPTSTSPSSSSPTQHLPVISVTTPPSHAHMETTAARIQQQQLSDNEAVPISPKLYSPITARAYSNLCRQYSVEQGRPSPWLVSPDSPSRSLSCPDDRSSTCNSANDNLSETEESPGHSPTTTTTATVENTPLPFQNSDSPSNNVPALECSNTIPRRMSLKKMSEKDDMIKQESLEFTVSENNAFPRSESTEDVLKDQQHS